MAIRSGLRATAIMVLSGALGAACDPLEADPEGPAAQQAPLEAEEAPLYVVHDYEALKALVVAAMRDEKAPTKAELDASRDVPAALDTTIGKGLTCDSPAAENERKRMPFVPGKFVASRYDSSVPLESRLAAMPASDFEPEPTVKDDSGTHE